MSKRIPLVALIFTLGGAAVALCVGSQGENELALGISQTQEGDFDAAVVTLDGVVRRLAREGAPPKTVARAYLYLSIAYFGLYQTEQAKAKFLEALQADPEMEITASAFPPRIYRFLDQVRREAHAQQASEGTPESPPATPAPELAPRSEEPEKGGSKMPLVLLGVGGAAAAGVALAVGGGSDEVGGSPTETTVPQGDGRVTETLSYTLNIASPSSGYVIDGPRFTTSAAGPIDITATFTPTSNMVFGIGLLYTSPLHNEGSGGSASSGTGPTLTGHWEVGFVGEFWVHFFPAGYTFPLPIPSTGITVPVTFQVTHP